MGGSVGGRTDGSDRLPVCQRPVLRGDARRVPGHQDVGGRVGWQALDVVVVGEDADPDVRAQRPPEGVVARHDEEVGHLVRAGDDHLFGVGQLGRLGRAPVNGRETGRDAVAEALSGVGQGCPGAGALEQARRQPRLERGDLAADGGLRGAQFARRQGEVAVPRGALERDQRVRGGNPVWVAGIHDC